MELSIVPIVRLNNSYKWIISSQMNETFWVIGSLFVTWLQCRLRQLSIEGTVLMTVQAKNQTNLHFPSIKLAANSTFCICSPPLHLGVITWDQFQLSPYHLISALYIDTIIICSCRCDFAGLEKTQPSKKANYSLSIAWPVRTLQWIGR